MYIANCFTRKLFCFNLFSCCSMRKYANIEYTAQQKEITQQLPTAHHFVPPKIESRKNSIKIHK